MYLCRLLICGLLIKIIYFLQGASGRSVPMNRPRAASPWPDLLEFAAGSDVSIVVKHEIEVILGKSNGQSLVSLIYYLFQSKQILLMAKSHHIMFYVTLMRMTDTIVVFSVWASNTLKMRSWMTHAPVVGV